MENLFCLTTALGLSPNTVKIVSLHHAIVYKKYGV